MGGGLRIVDSSRSLIFDEQMLEPGMKFPSSRLEAVYAVPFEDSRVSVIFTNTTAQPVIVDGDAIFAGANGNHPVQGNLGPYETKIVNLPPGLVKKAQAGAVSLNHNGAAGALLAMIHLQDAGRGYSESVNFTNPGGKTTELHGAGLRLGSVNNDPLKPVIAVRNLGDSATTVTASVPYSKQNGDTGTIALPQISLAPGEIKLLNTSNPQLRRNDFATAGLEVKYTSAPGSVIASATSVSQSGDQVFALPLKDPQGGLSSTGGYPWFIAGSSSTVVLIKNVTNEPQQFKLEIIYPEGRWGTGVRSIAANQTIAMDVRKLRDAQEKGSEGNTIPLTASSGHVSWSFRQKPNKGSTVGAQVDKVLIGRAQTVDLSNGLVSTYECQCICGWNPSDARLLPGAVSGFPGGITNFTLQTRDRDCHGNLTGYSNFLDLGSVDYLSGNVNVATFVYPGRGTARAPGQTYLRATVHETENQAQLSNEQVGTWICVAVAAALVCEVICDVQPPDFTITHNKSATGIRPSGIIAGINGADPPIPTADTQATVTVSTTPPTSGLNVTLSVVANEGFGLSVGWHIDHIGVRPVGTLSSTSGTTNQNGVFTAVYTAPQFSGGHRIRATVDGVTKDVGIGVFIDGLQELPAGNNYVKTGDTPHHPFPHWGTAVAIANLPLIANDYQAMYPGSAFLRYNDISLALGGRFDVTPDRSPPNWQNASHAEHRVGRNCDVRASDVPAARWAALNQIFRNNSVVSINDETASRNHWHLRF